MKMQYRYLLVLYVFLIVGCSTAYSIDSPTTTVSGTIRSPAPDSWCVIDDAGHESQGISAVSAVPSCVQMYFTFTARKIRTFIAVTDEAFASQGYFIGSSCGADHVDIYIYQILNGVVVPVDAETIASPWGNIWFYGEFEI